LSSRHQRRQLKRELTRLEVERDRARGRLLDAEERRDRTVADTTAAIEAFASAHAPEAIDAMIAFVERHFPRATLQGRMAEGPILDFLRSAKPEIVDDITQAIDDGFGALETYLIRYAKAQGS
jgi:hypothetical protein